MSCSRRQKQPLKITNVQKEDYGKCKCIAKNVVGEKESGVAILMW